MEFGKKWNSPKDEAHELLKENLIHEINKE